MYTEKDMIWAMELGAFYEAVLRTPPKNQPGYITVACTVLAEPRQLTAANPNAPKALTAYRTQMEKSR